MESHAVLNAQRFKGVQRIINTRRDSLNRVHNRSFDRRSRLYLTFVENISRRLSKKALWEAFSVYSTVVNVYIPSFYRFGKVRNVTFAFVRYKFEFQLKKAIEEGNNRKIDGHFIKVQKAHYGWTNNGSNRRSQKSHLVC
ncbi:hypothetical protein REPUB_Repub16aG0048300 [Reevesia pubescens]